MKTEQDKIESKELDSPMVIQDCSNTSIYLDKAKFDQLCAASQVFSDSGLVPEHFQGKMANCILALQMAIRLDVDPLTLMQNIYIISGKPAMEGKFVIGLVNARGPFTGPIQWDFEGEGATRQATAWAIDRATGNRCEVTVSIQMAKDEGWYGRNTKWKNLPDLMLRYRSGAWLGRAYAPECLLGLQTSQEAADIAPPPAPFNPELMDGKGRQKISRVGSSPEIVAESKANAPKVNDIKMGALPKKPKPPAKVVEKTKKVSQPKANLSLGEMPRHEMIIQTLAERNGVSEKTAFAVLDGICSGFESGNPITEATSDELDRIEILMMDGKIQCKE